MRSRARRRSVSICDSPGPRVPMPGCRRRPEALEVRPQAAHAREVVLELRELDLELALGAVRVPGEDVEDHRGAVDDRHPELLLEVALLARAELVVAGDDVRVGLLGGRLDLLELARAEVGVRVRLLAVLDDLADDGDARGAQQLAQLGEVVARLERGDAERALLRAPARLLRRPCGPRLRGLVAFVACATQSRRARGAAVTARAPCACARSRARGTARASARTSA